MKIGIYCTVSQKEFRIALATLSFAALSNYVSEIAILITDAKPDCPRKFTEKITVYSQYFGAGYEIAIDHGGYDQIAARNYLIEKMYATGCDWILMHDADDLYDLEYYQFISEECINADAVTCSCFSLRFGPEVCVPLHKNIKIQNLILYEPHTRIWKKNLDLRYEKSNNIENFYANHSRHCGVSFPEHTRIYYTDRIYHFHLHALLSKRHSNKISAYSTYKCVIPSRVSSFLEENYKFFYL